MPMNTRTFALAAALIVAAPFALALGAPPKKADDEAANVRIQPVAKVELAGAAPAAAAGAGGAAGRTGDAIYKASCAACHDTGVANAPKFGDKAAWAPRLALGFDGLIKSAIKGKNAMPPRGASDANDTELARAIAFMANKAGASFSAK